MTIFLRKLCYDTNIEFIVYLFVCIKAGQKNHFGPLNLWQCLLVANGDIFCTRKLVHTKFREYKKLGIWQFRTVSSNFCQQDSGGAAVDPSIQTSLLIKLFRHLILLSIPYHS
jgi:hypothetical protein